MNINLKRMLNDFSTIVSFTRTPNNGCTRFSYSYEDRQTREYLISQMKDLDLSIKVDAVGNIRAKYGMEIKKTSIMIGSHIDTVENGGKYDGLSGVLVALEIIRVLKEEQVAISHPIELIIFAEEEGSNFGVTMLGSKVLTGKYGTADLKRIKNGEGVSAYDIAKSFGLSVDHVEKDVLENEEVDAMIELHIEQGAVLETQNKSVGIVQAIAGMKTFKINLEGDSNHAGTTPMDLRQDPMAGAATIISHIRQVAKTQALPTTVATVGKIICQPNMPNVIPQRVEFFVDVRDVDSEGIDLIANALTEKVNAVTTEDNLQGKIELIGESNPVKLSSRITHAIEETASEYGYNYMRMNSGAVHDAAMMTDLTDVGMIFIPSMEGKSHSPDEYTRQEDIKSGGDLLLQVIEKLAVKTKETNQTSR
ncbi:Zn-dependent hydrolase [Virgibacillus sp. NKC19-16]|uniref:Zn-dependent hydrolase n=1 Tax=Virgibacillus salidurans TaxID=2831673 RepID=UPI001F32CCF3|nr:Zn-dependent hydrolase [Virgibacillus sp. NKC19-16]UJL47442.1 Zn-dependent hydrolase [Virgibacillus sp. NKC19-16]